MRAVHTALISLALLACARLATAQVGTTKIVSVTSTGAQGFQDSRSASVDESGRYVAFVTYSALVPRDSGIQPDVYLRDTILGTTDRVSEGPNNESGNGVSFGAEMAKGGLFVVFYSRSSNLVPNDTNNVNDIFIWDRKNDSMERVSVAENGAEGNGTSYSGSVDRDGTVVAFVSAATNLVDGDNNGVIDVFIADRVANTMDNITLGANGPSRNPSISADGRFVAFESEASNLVANDNNDEIDIIMYDRQAGTIKRVSVSSVGVEANDFSSHPEVNGDGRFVVFSSWASNLIAGDGNQDSDIFIHDRLIGTTDLISKNREGIQANGYSIEPSISTSGRFVAFVSSANNLNSGGDFNGHRDIFVRDQITGAVVIASRTDNGSQANDVSQEPSLSGDGRFVAFDTYARNFGYGDTSSDLDVYLHQQFDIGGPVSYLHHVGLRVGGNLRSLYESNDDRLVSQPGPVFSTQSWPLVIVFDAVGSIDTPSTLTFEIESRGSAGTLLQRIEFFNYVTNSYEEVDSRLATTSDSLITISITSNATRFVGPFRGLRARVSYKATGPVFAYPWSAGIDLIRWTMD